MDEMHMLGIGCVDDSVPNDEEISISIYKKCVSLIADTKKQLEQWLDEQGYRVEMGVVFLKEYQ